ncbi:MAG TPA: hypothetical protein VKB73_09955 [Gaiellaceae bacterium]|nr:hypothetical protein [Gaiellaceae bacterium]
MEEARAVLHRLERIEALEREGAPARSMLAEVRALLAEAEVWAATEREGTDVVEHAVRRCRDALGAKSRSEDRAEAVPG